MIHITLFADRATAHTIRDLMVHMRPWRMGHDHADGRMPRSAHTRRRAGRSAALSLLRP